MTERSNFPDLGTGRARLDDEHRDLESELISARVRAKLFNEPVEPVRIGRYRILRREGHGATGVVYSAQDEVLDREVALKIFRGSPDEASRARSFREAKSLASLRHPNVIGVYDTGVEGDAVWIAMEFVRGQTLRAWAKERPRTWHEVRHVMIQVACGVAAAHDVGLVHGDLKPDNAMLDWDGHVKVLDFGLADRHRKPVGGDTTATGEPPPPAQTPVTRVVHGTPGYIAPEVLLGAPGGAAADQFGWSVIAWELLYGERPFPDEASALAGRLQPPPGRSVPRRLRQIVERGLAARPAERHTSMASLIRALRKDPTLGRKLALGGALCAVIVGVAVAASQSQHQQKIAACVAAGDAISATWGDPARTRLRDGLLQTGAGFAATTVARISPQLDAYAESWRTARTELCLATTVENRGDLELAEVAIGCFEESRQYLESLISTLASAAGDENGREITLNAAMAVTRLPRIASCEDMNLLRMRPRMPVEADSRRSIQRIRGTLAGAAALAAAGSGARSLARVDVALRDSAAIGWAPLHVEVELQRAKLLALLAKHAEAEALLNETFYSSGEVEADEVHAEAAILLAEVVGRSQRHHEDGLVWGRMAEMLLRRQKIDANDGRWSLLYRCLGHIHGALGHHEESIALHEKALGIHRAMHGPVHPDIGDDLGHLANQYREKGDFERAIALATQGVEMQEIALGPDHPGVAHALGNLGAIYANMHSHDRSLALLQRVLELQRKAFGPEHPDVALTLANIGVVHYQLGALGPAQAAMMEALAIRERTRTPDHPDLANSLHGLGTVLIDLGQVDRGVDLLNRAVEIWEKALGLEDPHIAGALNTLAIVAGERGDDARAIELMRRAVAIQERAYAQGHPVLPILHANLGLALLAKGEHVEARMFLERAVEPLENSGEPGTLGQVRFALAQVLWPSPDQRLRAMGLARAALEDLEAGGPLFADEAREARAWLKAHAR